MNKQCYSFVLQYICVGVFYLSEAEIPIVASLTERALCDTQGGRIVRVWTVNWGKLIDVANHHGQADH